MRLVNTSFEDIDASMVDLEKGRIYKQTIIRPNAVPVDDKTKFAYEDGDYEEVEVYEEYADEKLLSKKISFLKHQLTETDYVIIKIAEGSATAEEYADIIANRKAWRKEINELEASLLALSSDSE